MRWISLLALLPVTCLAQIELIPAKVGTTSYVSQCFPIYSLANPEVALTGITGSTTSFKISVIADNQSSDTEFETTADIETISTIGTYAAPTANTDIRFGECPISGHYQIMPHNDLMNISGAQKLTFVFSDGGSTMLDQTVYLYQDIADLNDIGGEVQDTLETAEVEAGLTYQCAMAVIKAVSAGEFTRVAGSGSAGTTTYVATDDSTTRVVGTVNSDSTARTSVTITCP